MDLSAAMTTVTGQMIDAIGETITYTPQPGGTPVSIKALVDLPSTNIQLAMGPVGSYNATAHCKTSDIPSAKKNDLITARSVNYKVAEVNPDGTGMTELVLMKA